MKKSKKQGYRDYDPLCEPADLNSYTHWLDRVNYLEGWKKAEKDYIEGKEKEKLNFDVYHADEKTGEDTFLGTIDSFDVANGHIRIDGEIFIRQED